MPLVVRSRAELYATGGWAAWWVLGKAYGEYEYADTVCDCVAACVASSERGLAAAEAADDLGDLILAEAGVLGCDSLEFG